MIGGLLLVFNLVALGAVAWRGDRCERITVAVILAAILVEPFLQPIQISTWRIGVAVGNVALFLALWLLAERAERWWLVFAASIQLLIVATHLIPLTTDQSYTWSGVSLRLGLWSVLSLILFVGAWEAWAARKYAQEGAHSDPDYLRGGRSPLP